MLRFRLSDGEGCSGLAKTAGCDLCIIIRRSACYFWGDKSTKKGAVTKLEKPIELRLFFAFFGKVKENEG